MTRDDVTASGYTLGYELDRYREIAESQVRSDPAMRRATATEFCRAVAKRMERLPGFPGWPYEQSNDRDR